MVAERLLEGQEIIVEIGKPPKITVLPPYNNNKNLLNANDTALCQVAMRVDENGDVVDVKCTNVSCAGRCTLHEAQDGTSIKYSCKCS